MKNYLMIVIPILFLTACNSNESIQNTEKIYVDMQNVNLADDLDVETNIVRIGSVNFEKVKCSTGWDNYIWAYEGLVYYVTSQGIMVWSPIYGESLFLNESDINGIVIDESVLYYYTKNEMALYRMDTDGSMPELVFDKSMISISQAAEQICGFMVYNQSLFIKDTPVSCIRFDMNTREQSYFNQDFSSGVFLNDMFYYIDYAQRTFSIFRTNVQTGHTELLRGDGITYEFENPKKTTMYDQLIVLDDKLFYSTRMIPEIYLYNEDKQDLLISSFSEVEQDILYLDITTDGTYLYYTHQGTNLLYCFNPQTAEVTEITAPGDFRKVNSYTVINDVLYYSIDNGSMMAFELR